MNIFMNLVKRFSEVGGTKAGVGALRKVRAPLLLASDISSWVPVSSSCFVRSTEKLTQVLRQVLQDLEAVPKDGGLNIILLN